MKVNYYSSRKLILQTSLLLLMALITCFEGAWAQSTPYIQYGNTNNTKKTGSWTAPATGTVTVECWGGGGAGGRITVSTTFVSRGGGGGGAYARSTFSVTQGTTYYWQIGAGAPSGGLATATDAHTWFNSAGANSQPSSISNGTLAVGGATGVQSTTGAAGGAAASCFGNLATWSGGNGQNGVNGGASGAGGCSAKPNAAGQNGSAVMVRSGCQGIGGAQVSSTTSANGNPAPSVQGDYGGGGGGANSAFTGGARTGGAGAPGRLAIYMNGPGIFSITQGGSTVTSACAGSTIRLTADNGYCYCNGSSFSILGTTVSGAVTYSNISGTQQKDNVDLTIPCNLSGTGDIVVTSPAGTTTYSGFTVNAPLSSASISPSFAQAFAVSTTGNQLTVSESGCGTVTSRQWGYRTTSGGTITNISGQTGTSYTPAATDLNSNSVGTYYIVCSSTVGSCSITQTSNEVQVDVTNGGCIPPTAPTGPASQSLCTGATVSSLSATGTGIKWYDAASNGNLLSGSTVLVNGNTYYASQTITCESTDRLAVTVTVNSLPVAPTGTSPQIFCPTSSPTVANLSATGNDIKWYNASSAGTLYSTSTALVNNTIYYASQTDAASGCESSSRLAVTAQLVAVPGVISPTSSSVTDVTAVLGGTISNIGCNNVTERGIYWSTTNGFTPPGQGTKVSETPGPYSTGAFTINVSGLAHSTTYYFKAFATNSDGTTYTTQGTFTTATPTLSVSALADFGSVCLNSTAGPNSFTITGTYLTAANVTVAALDGFTYSTTPNGTYSSSLSLSQSGGSYSQTIYVKFTPTAEQSYNGNIVVGGGGVGNVNCAATGTSYFTVSTGTGVDGAYIAPAGTSSLASGTYNYSSFTIPSGSTVTVIGSSPLVINCTGAVSINGTLDLSGSNGSNNSNACSIGASTAGGAGGAGGGGGGASGGNGGNSTSSNGTTTVGSNGTSFGSFSGRGLGGGVPNSYGSGGGGGGGGGASYGTLGSAGGMGSATIFNPSGTSGGSSGSIYGDAGISTYYSGSVLLGGSGGAGGGASSGNPSRSSGAGGGGGGGAVGINAQSVDLTNGLISVKGGNGGSGSSPASCSSHSGGYAAGGAGGGGSGGTVLINYITTCTSCTVGSNVNISGGTGGTGTSWNGATGGNGGSGGNGRFLARISSTAIVTAAGTSPINQGGSSSLSGSYGGGGATGATWTDGGIGGTFFPNATTLNATWTPPGSYYGTAVLTLTSTGGTCSGSDTVHITVNQASTINYSVRVLMQGYYLGGGKMSPLLHLLGASSLTVTDTVTVELHNASNPYEALYSFTDTIRSNGNISCIFPAGAAGSHYVVVKHRNSLETWSASPQTITGGGSYDFTTNSGQAYGSNQVNLGGGVFGIYSGDINQNESISNADKILLQGVLSDFPIGVYSIYDITGDGFVDEDDLRIMQNNVPLGINKSAP